MDIELTHNLAAVGLDGFNADVELLSDLFGGIALGHKLKDLAFPVTDGLLACEIRLCEAMNIIINDDA